MQIINGNMGWPASWHHVLKNSEQNWFKNLFPVCGNWVSLNMPSLNSRQEFFYLRLTVQITVSTGTFKVQFIVEDITSFTHTGAVRVLECPVFAYAHAR